MSSHPASLRAPAALPYNRAVERLEVVERRRIQQLSPVAGQPHRRRGGDRAAGGGGEGTGRERPRRRGDASIIVEAEDGGRALIRVIDDGARHPARTNCRWRSPPTPPASSPSDDDLFRIATMGFRGEALASIGSVSHARILSRTPDSEAAYEIHNRGGEIGDVQAAAGNVGTTVEVRNLFFNTPARRKFIKGARHGVRAHFRDGPAAGPAAPAAWRSACCTTAGSRWTCPPPTPEQRLLAAWPEEFHEQRLPIDAARRRGAAARHGRPAGAGPPDRHDTSTSTSTAGTSATASSSTPCARRTAA